LWKQVFNQDHRRATMLDAETTRADRQQDWPIAVSTSTITLNSQRETGCWPL